MSIAGRTMRPSAIANGASLGKVTNVLEEGTARPLTERAL